MGWFTQNKSLRINETITVEEGHHKYWKFNAPSAVPVSLYVKRMEGYGPNVYLMSVNEYANFVNGLGFKYFTNLSLEDVDEFTNNCTTIMRGDYVLVVYLPIIYDDTPSYTDVLIRFEEVR